MRDAKKDFISSKETAGALDAGGGRWTVVDESSGWAFVTSGSLEASGAEAVAFDDILRCFCEALLLTTKMYLAKSSRTDDNTPDNDARSHTGDDSPDTEDEGPSPT